MTKRGASPAYVSRVDSTEQKCMAGVPLASSVPCETDYALVSAPAILAKKADV